MLPKQLGPIGNGLVNNSIIRWGKQSGSSGSAPVPTLTDLAPIYTFGTAYELTEDSNGILIKDDPIIAGEFAVGVGKSLISTEFKYTFHVSVGATEDEPFECGIFVRDVLINQCHILNYYKNVGVIEESFDIHRRKTLSSGSRPTSTTNYNQVASVLGDMAYAPAQTDFVMQVEQNATHRIFRVGPTKDNWLATFSRTLGSTLATPAEEVGFYYWDLYGSTDDAFVRITGFEEEIG